MGINGKYEMVESEHYDDFLKSVGAGMYERNQVWKYKPLMEWVPIDNGKWKQKTSSGSAKSEISFVPGEEFEEELFGRKLKSRIILDGNRLIHCQKMGPVEAIVTREFNGEGMISIFQAGDTVATRIFKKVD